MREVRQAKKQFARTLRKRQTLAEKLIWELLRQRKFKALKFRRQHVVEGFILDFYCHELRLGIEVDGPIHLKQKEYDQARQEIIESKNITVVRITNDEVSKYREQTLQRLEEILLNHSTPLPLGEGQRREDQRKGEIG